MTASRARFVTGCIDRPIKVGVKGIRLVAANPVNVMAQVAFRKPGFAAGRVIGAGGVERVLVPELSLAEQAALPRSAGHPQGLGDARRAMSIDAKGLADTGAGVALSILKVFHWC